MAPGGDTSVCTAPAPGFGRAERGDGAVSAVGVETIASRHQKIKQPSCALGRQQLGELMRCIGLGRIEDTDQLIGCPLQIKLSIRPAENGYAAQNEVRGFRVAEGAAPAKAAPAASSSKAAPPWAKK